MLDEIALISQPGHVWRDAQLMDTLVTPLTTVGFIDLGAFTAPPIQKLVLRLLVDETAGIIAAIFEHPRTGHWLELWSHFLDGGSICYGTSPTPPYSRPDHLRMNTHGLSPFALLNLFKQDRPDKLVRPTDRHTAMSVFVDAYADEEKWRKAHQVLPVAFARATFAPFRTRVDGILSTVRNVVPGLNRRQRHQGVVVEALTSPPPPRPKRPESEQSANSDTAPRNGAAHSTSNHTELRRKRTHWEVLGVQQGASRQELRASYLARCKEYHPDRVATLGARVREVADEEIRAITAAYEALTRAARG